MIQPYNAGGLWTSVTFMVAFDWWASDLSKTHTVGPLNPILTEGCQIVWSCCDASKRQSSWVYVPFRSAGWLSATMASCPRLLFPASSGRSRPSVESFSQRVTTPEAPAETLGSSSMWQMEVNFETNGTIFREHLKSEEDIYIFFKYIYFTGWAKQCYDDAAQDLLQTQSWRGSTRWAGRLRNMPFALISASTFPGREDKSLTWRTSSSLSEVQ